MRSDLVFGALVDVPNRYLLCKLTAKATRAFHRPGTSIHDTTNNALARFSPGSLDAGSGIPYLLQRKVRQQPWGPSESIHLEQTVGRLIRFWQSDARLKCGVASGSGRGK
jgi:hypothetical protein